MAAHGHFQWNELLTRDVERAKNFYEQTIGWTFEPMPMDDGATYWIASIAGAQVAGLFPTNRAQFDSVPEAWMSYLSVDDVDRRVEKAIKAGATLMRPVFEVPECGAHCGADRARRRRHRVDDADRLIANATRSVAATCRPCKTLRTKKPSEFELARAFCV